MSMPEAAVNENHCSAGRKHEVRVARQASLMKPEATSATVKEPSDN